MVRDERKVFFSNVFNDFFVNAVPNFGINTEHNFLNTTNISHNPIENAIYHPSAIAIKNHMKGAKSSFSFQAVTKENTAKLITNLDNKKSCSSYGYPNKVSQGVWLLLFKFYCFQR